MIVKELPIINALVLRVPQNISAYDLTDDPRVAGVEDDQAVKLQSAIQGNFASFIEPAPRPPSDHYPWGVLKLYDQYYDPWFLTSAYERDDLPDPVRPALDRMKQEKIKIAVFDSGIFYLHLNLFNVAKGGIDLTNTDAPRKGLKKLRRKLNKKSKKRRHKRIKNGVPLDDNGHGTHVAGIICAALDPYGKWGRESPIELYAVKILDKQAMGDLSDVIMGLQWAIDNNIDIANMSIGYSQDSFAVRKAVQVAHESGLILIASVGNHSNWDESMILAADGGAADGGAAGESTVVNPAFSVMYPARYPEVIAVGASTPFGESAGYNNFGEDTDAMAPGSSIISADITNGKIFNGFGFCSATSQATAHVTAVVAMMLAVEPALAPEEGKAILVTTSMAAAGAPAGEIDLTAALKQAWLLADLAATENSSGDDDDDD